MLVSTKEMLEDARKNHYAVPSPDFWDSNSVRAFCDVADELKKPCIISLAEVHMEHMSVAEAALMGKFYAEKARAPIALHLDHGVHFDVIEEAIEKGFTSVMIDASSYDIEENIKRTLEVVKLAHSKGVTVEAEIGHVGSEEEDGPHAVSENIYTEVDAAARFMKETGVDSLAVSIGTSHGKYKGTPVINFERLAEINAAVDVPLVIHGGSGSGDENLRRCVEGGITKVNLFTDFIVAALNRTYEDKASNWLNVLTASDDAVKDVLRHYYNVLGCV